MKVRKWGDRKENQNNKFLATARDGQET